MTQGVRIEKSCDWCGRPMVLRRNRQNDSEFWGCTGYPECTRTAAPPTFLDQIRQGAQQFEGF